jgi:hypothetical protein
LKGMTEMFETFKRRVAKLEQEPRNRMSALRALLAIDAPVLHGSSQFEQLLTDGKLVGRIVIAPDEPTPKEPIL